VLCCACVAFGSAGAAEQKAAPSAKPVLSTPILTRPGLQFINTSFENASPLQWEMDTNGTVQIGVLYDYERNAPNRAAGHWHFQLQGTPWTELTLELRNFHNVWNGRPGYPVSEKSICYLSEDGQRWRVIPAEFLTGGVVRLQVRLEGPELYLARLEPYRISDLDRLLESIGQHRLIEITRIGRTVQGRPLEIVRVGRAEAPLRVLVRARAHPWEPAGNWIVQGLIRAALTESETSRRFLERCCVYVLPMANKDGVARGATRFNALGVDLNRGWEKRADPALAPENAALEGWIESMHGAGRRLHFAMDIHNDESGGLHLSAAAPEKAARYNARLKKFETLLREHTWFREAVRAAGLRTAATMTIAEGLLERYDIDGCVLEFNCNWITGLGQHPTGKAYEDFGRDLLKVFAALESEAAADPHAPGR
jgi:hypothetical protein